MRRIANYAEAETYLFGTIDETVSRRTSYKLDRMRALLSELGDPHRAYPTIHVGGTSGKGSTATMIAGALHAAGKRTGLHTKPHLGAMTERARIDGASIPPERFAVLLDEMLPAIARAAAQHGRPTYYETLLALAFKYFADERVDVAVIEVGLGGRLDGTNVILPVVAAITSVGYDHTDVLGETIEAIALEKAGIAKPRVPLVLAPMPAAALQVIERYAAGVGAPIVHVAQVVRVERERTEERGGTDALGVHAARVVSAPPSRRRRVPAHERGHRYSCAGATGRRASSAAGGDRSGAERRRHSGADGAGVDESDGRLRHRTQRGEGRVARRLAARVVPVTGAFTTWSLSARARTPDGSSRSWGP